MSPWAVGLELIVRLAYDQIEIHLELKELFKSCGRSYTEDPKLSDFIKIRLGNLPFDQVLSLVLWQVEGAKQIEVIQQYEIF